MINTYNESDLHRTIKKIYSLESDSRTEVECNGYIYDIIKQDGSIIEIQTKNLSNLLKKITETLKNGKKIKIVHPVAIIKTIQLIDGNGEKISKRKSSKKESIYSMFNELTKIYPILLNKNFSLDILLTNITEIRKKTLLPVQSKNKRRRFCKNWIKTNKKLDEIIESKTFNSANDYISLIPNDILPNFTTKTLAESLKHNITLPNTACTYASIMIWVLVKMELIEQIGLQNKSRLYKIKEEYINPQKYGFFL